MKKFVLFLSLAAVWFAAQSQTVGYNWLKQQSGSGTDASTDVVISKNNFVYTCGFFTGTTVTAGSTTLTNAGTSNACAAFPKREKQSSYFIDYQGNKLLKKIYIPATLYITL